ncbi:hypothetical protein BHE74_00016574 [Ensete ventricosum]|nr:hypothetical protein BHE74_00016574 [Ensete ventricosum]
MASLREHLAVLAVLVAVAIRLAAGRFVVEKESISVVSPQSLRGHHAAAIANFGVPNYGGTLTGVVVYPGKQKNGCEAFGGDPFRSKSGRPVILLVDRGDCYFALKAYNGQQNGAAAVIVADTVEEPLLTMDAPEESDNEYVEKINIPSALVTQAFGNSLKEALGKGAEEVVVKLDWRESMPHPDERVEYELWTNSNDECGDRCDEQMEFVTNFKGHAQLLEKGGFTRFTPHYITWYCPDAFKLSRECKAQCINNGRYCAPDPEQDFGEGYDGKDIVIENLRQLCVHRVANDTGRPWVWWDVVTDYHVRCSMKEKKYSKECAEHVISKCMGDPEADVENDVLRTEQLLQDSDLTGCRCPYGFHGDGYRCEGTYLILFVLLSFALNPLENECPARFNAIDVDECKEKLACNCPECSCKNTWGGYDCKCKGNLLYIKSQDACIGEDSSIAHSLSMNTTQMNFLLLRLSPQIKILSSVCNHCAAKSASKFGWFMTLFILACVIGAGTAAYVFYKYRLRVSRPVLEHLPVSSSHHCYVTANAAFLQSYMDSEIMAIMSQYMPLDNHNDEARPLREDTAA